MNRFAVRLLIAFLAVSILSLAIVPISQTIAERQTLAALANDFRERIEERNRSRLGRNGSRPPQPTTGAFLLEENNRLYTLFSNYRQAQRRSMVIGIVLALGMGILLALWLARSIAHPIEAVSRAASSLRKGNLQTRVQLSSLSTQPQETLSLAENFNQMATTLETLEEERKAMIADIAHELRNPLATLQFRLDALEDGITKYSEEELSLLQSQVGLLSRLVEDLRTLSLADAKQLSLYKQTLNLTELVERGVKQVEERALQAHIDLRYKLEPGLFTYGDPDRLHQVLQNLLDNAFKLTPKGGWVEVLLQDEENNLQLSVIDSGPGIPVEKLNTLFRRFVKGERRDVKVNESSGLGLAIVQTLVQLHGGEVKASNHKDGARFDVYLPK